LIFGVTDRPPRRIVGSNYRHQKPGLEKLKREISKQTNHQTTFNDIHELMVDDKRVVLFQIPPALRGVPTTWQGIAYGRIHDSLGPLNLQKIETIRRQAIEDWSAGICDGATIDDLDPDAIALARKNYAKKNLRTTSEIAYWDDITFLNKAKVCISGEITRAAIILLGKNEAEHFVSPGIARITWLLRDEPEHEKDYAHFAPPIVVGR